MEVLVFDIKGAFAHFRAPDTTRENISYPFPPRTALIGLLAGILGCPRNEYWLDSELKECKLSIQLLNPVLRSRIKVNYLQTRNFITISGVTILLPRDPFEVKAKDQRGFNAPVNLNILRNVAFRIFVSFEEDCKIKEELEWRLKEQKYCFPPYLGHANMLAEILYIGKFKGHPLESGVYDVKSIFPSSSLDLKNFSLDDFGYSMLFNVPNSLSYEDGKIVLNSTENIVLNESSNTEGITASFKTNKVYEIDLNGELVRIAFLGN